MAVTDEPWRELTEEERGTIARILEKDFPGRDALVAQLPTARARPSDEVGSIEIQAPDGPPSQAPSPVPVYAACPDADGFEIEVALYLRDGRLSELRIAKVDDSAIMHWPTGPRLRIS